jgi:hypothetical protein
MMFLHDEAPETLQAVNDLVEKLLRYENLLPVELYIKLDTYHADLADALEPRSL